MLNICFINLTTGQNQRERERLEREKVLIRHTVKTKNDFSLKTIEGRDRKFLIEKLIHNIEFKDHYQNLTEKKPELIQTIEDNYKVNRHKYQSLFSDITGSFLSIYTLDPDEMQELDSDLKANGWGLQSITEIQVVHHLLFFKCFTILMGDFLLQMG